MFRWVGVLVPFNPVLRLSRQNNLTLCVEINYCRLVIEGKHLVSVRMCLISKKLARVSDSSFKVKHLIISLISVNQLLSTPAAN